MNAQPIILAAEDEESDALLLGMAFKRAKIPNQLVIVRDGQEAIDYLKGVAPYHDRFKYPLPGLLLLDLNMPRMTGFDVLAWLAGQPFLKNLPTVVLSSSAQDSDLEKARRLGAVDYSVKPTGLNHLVVLVQKLAARWLTSPAAQISLPASPATFPATPARPTAPQSP
jgi:CheY-like chemotaxis protein